MDFDKLRDQWRQAPEHVSLMPADELSALDGALWKKVRRRDRWETIVAVILAVFFSLVALGAVVDGAWVLAASALLITAWSIALPFQLKRGRLDTTADGHGATTLEYLRRRRDASLVQARMLERVWLWYLTPPAIGVTGIKLASDGVTAGSLTYLGGMVVLYAAIAWFNRRAARTRFRAHAAVLQQQIDALAGDGE